MYPKRPWRFQCSDGVNQPWLDLRDDASRRQYRLVMIFETPGIKSVVHEIVHKSETFGRSHCIQNTSLSHLIENQTLFSCQLTSPPTNMPTYAILGGTGATGSALINLLGREPDTKLHVYARSSPKLLKAHPMLSEPGSPHNTFTGDFSDVALLKNALRTSMRSSAWSVPTLTTRTATSLRIQPQSSSRL